MIEFTEDNLKEFIDKLIDGFNKVVPEYLREKNDYFIK